jgi:DNA-binding response OmpR family regulator
MRVLLVEDDEGVASALAELLGHAGADVIRTGRGADALHRVKGCDLVLLDLGLPDMDGLDVLRTLRRASAVPVIIMTARCCPRGSHGLRDSMRTTGICWENAGGIAVVDFQA